MVVLYLLCKFNVKSVFPHCLPGEDVEAVQPSYEHYSVLGRLYVSAETRSMCELVADALAAANADNDNLIDDDYARSYDTRAATAIKYPLHHSDHQVVR